MPHPPLPRQRIMQNACSVCRMPGLGGLGHKELCRCLTWINQAQLTSVASPDRKRPAKGATSNAATTETTAACHPGDAGYLTRHGRQQRTSCTHFSKIHPQTEHHHLGGAHPLRGLNHCRAQVTLLSVWSQHSNLSSPLNIRLHAQQYIVTQTKSKAGTADFTTGWSPTLLRAAQNRKSFNPNRIPAHQSRRAAL